MKTLRILLWMTTGGALLLGLVGRFSLILLPVALLAGLAASRLPLPRGARSWLIPASTGAAIACLVLFGLAPEKFVYLLLWIGLLILAAILAATGPAGPRPDRSDPAG